MDKQKDNSTNPNLLQAALDYAARGWYVFPCNEQGPKAKKPYTKNGFKDATTDPDQIRKWWTRYPRALIGIDCDRSNLFVFDLDVKDDKDGILHFTKWGIDTGGGLMTLTPSLGWHIIFSGKGKSLTTEQGIDIRSKGGYIIAPPSIILDGDYPGEYQALGDWTRTPEPIPAGLMEAFESWRASFRGKPAQKNTQQATPVYKPDDVEKARDALDRLDPWRCDDYHAWIETGMSLSPLGAAGLNLWDSWSRRSTKYQEGVCAHKWKSFKPGHGLTLGSLFHWANDDDPRPGPARVVVPGPAKPATDSTDQQSGEEEEDQPFPIYSAMPDLPKVARLTDAEESQAKQAGRFIDEYVNFGMKDAPMSPRLFHQSYALAILSTAIARRVYVNVGTAQIFPNLYMLLSAPSTLYTKTTGYKSAMKLLETAGLSHLLLPDGVTPQSLITELSNRPQENFKDWNQDDKEEWQKERLFAGQRAWWIDELARLLSQFQQKHLADLLPIILRLYDCEPKIKVSTQVRGRETVRNAYLTICGPTTPAALREHLKNHDYWTNGLFARFLLVTPDTPPIRCFYPPPFPVPASLAEHLNKLSFQCLESPKENLLGPVLPPPAKEAQITPEVWKHWDNYQAAMFELVSKKAVPEKLSSYYGRLHEKAIKIAMLLAASDWVKMATGNPLVIQMSHWARAQQITEGYRNSLHRIVEDASQPIENDDDELAQKIINKLTIQPLKSIPELARAFHMSTGDKYNRLKQTLYDLIETNMIEPSERKGARGSSATVYQVVKNL